MKEFFHKNCRPLMDLVTFAVIWAVFFFKGRFMMYLQEQMQLFQNDWHYVFENLPDAGGFAGMLTEAVVQFYHVPWLGVTLMSFFALSCVVALRRCLTCISDDWRVSEIFALASVIPLVYSVIACEDSFSMVSFAIVAACSAGLLSLRGRSAWAAVAVATPLLFVLCGASSILLPLVFAAASITRRRDVMGIVTALIPSCAYLVFGLVSLRTGMVGMPAELFARTYPLYDAPGQDFNLYGMLPWYIATAGAIVLGVLHAFRKSTSYWPGYAAGSVLVAGSVLFICLAPGKKYAENVGYDVYSDWAELHYLYSEGHHDRILSRYDGKTPENSVASNYVNLALYRTGRLTTDFFRYRPAWLHNSLRTPWIDMPFPFPFIWIETCDQMGALAKAQQAAFEGNILAGPRGSAPMVKYLAESEIIRGNYTAADKYLTSLGKTLFYRDWADEQRSFLNDEAVMANSHYSVKRACYYDETRTLYDMNDLWLMKEIAKSNPAHTSTFDYTGLMTLSAGELHTFVSFILEMSETGTIRLPLSPIFQDALIMAFPKNKELHKIYRIDPQRVSDYAEYAAAVSGKTQNKLNANAVISKNSTRVWHYLYILSKNAPKAQNQKQ